jgi:pimeloyl-ACP methyl ester carboxylesterase
VTDLRLLSGDVVLCGTAVGEGPTVLLLHAGGERRAVWAPVAELLAASGFRAVAYDLRGHGESPGIAETLSDVVSDVSAMIRSERAPITVVGASLGGFAAMAALAMPSTAVRASGLVLVDAVPDPDPVRVWEWLEQQHLRPRPPGLVQDILDRGAGLLAGVAALRMPVMLIRGGPGSPLTESDVARLRRANPRVEVVCVPAAGHLVARDAPAELGAVLIAALARWSRQALALAPANGSARADGTPACTSTATSPTDAGK